MFYKISNIASREFIEDKFNVTFEFPNLYKPKKTIEGLREATVAILTNKEPRLVKYAIWGILPEDFEDSWSAFQEIFNTLNVNIKDLKNGNSLYKNTVEERRCVILATGFYTTILNNGTLQLFHVHLPDNEPFAIAGIYNRLNDGFLTCSIIVKRSSHSFKEIPNISDLKPLVLNTEELSQWLDQSLSKKELDHMLENHDTMTFEYETEGLDLTTKSRY